MNRCLFQSEAKDTDISILAFGEPKLLLTEEYFKQWTYPRSDGRKRKTKNVKTMIEATKNYILPQKKDKD